MPTIKNILFTVFLLMGYRAGAQHQSGNVSLSGAALQKIYLTTDKVIYTPNEQLWFAAYLFENRLLVKDTSDVLTLGLYDPVSDGMVAIKKFPIHNRIATGNLLLPDTLVAGQYNLVAYTNLLDTQHVPIGTGFKPLRIYARTGDKAFTTSLKISDSLSTKDRIAILHEIIPESYQVTFKDARASYQLAGGRFRTLELNNYGNGIIYMDLKDVKNGNRSLSVTTVYNGDTARNRIRIPEVSDRPGDWSAAFYPEGGFLAAGYTNRIFWEVTHKNVASSSRALLLENDQVIDTIETLANGASAFNVNAKAGKQYAVTLDLKDQGIERFTLPPVNPDGIQIEIPRMIVNDTLSIELWSKEKKAVRLIVSDITGLISVHQLDINSYKKLAVILDEFARGLCKVFVVDSKNKILAKSYFFAHYKSRNRLDLQTDRDVYKIRDSVLLSIDINNSNGIPLNSMATVSCALLSRIDFNLAKSIESDHDFSSVIYNEPVFIKRRNVLDSSDLLEHIIRMKNMNDDDSVFLAGIPKKSLLKPAVQLQLARFGKQVKKQMDLVLLRDGNFSLLKTDEQGALPLSTDELLVKDGRKLSIKGMGKKNGDYYVLAEDALTKAYSNISFPVYQPVYREQAPDLQALLKTDKAEKFSSTMETVIVKSKREFGALGTANPCGDYVCQNNILNCFNHTVPFKWPVKGQLYNTVSGNKIVYEGCDYMNNLYLPATSLVYLPRTFLGMDTTLLKQEFPEYLSTLWWQPFKKINKDSKNKMVFHTSDQKGVYLITVQGFAENGQPFYGEKTIRVED